MYYRIRTGELHIPTNNKDIEKEQPLSFYLTLYPNPTYVRVKGKNEKWWSYFPYVPVMN